MVIICIIVLFLLSLYLEYEVEFDFIETFLYISYIKKVIDKHTGFEIKIRKLIQLELNFFKKK